MRDPEAVKAYRRAWRQKHRERLGAARRNRAEPQSSYNKAYYLKNLDRIRARRRKNAERSKAVNQAWAARNRELVKVLQANYRAALLGAAGTHTADDIKALFRLQRGRCVYCRAKLGTRYQMDHVQPFCRGGANDASNIQLLCSPCNGKKGRKDHIAFAKANGRMARFFTAQGNKLRWILDRMRISLEEDGTPTNV